VLTKELGGGGVMALKDHTRRKCFISYHHDDEAEVQQFIEDFDQDRDVLIARGIGASMSGDIINSTNSDYIMSKIREKYLRDTTVTLLLVGRCTWARKFVDWEIAASLRNTSAYNRNGLLAITLLSVADYSDRKLPARVQDNIAGTDSDKGYARWWKYPSSSVGLGDLIDTAYEYRASRGLLVDNSRALRANNSVCL
jgi:hypothetical protein